MSLIGQQEARVPRLGQEPGIAEALDIVAELRRCDSGSGSRWEAQEQEKRESGSSSVSGAASQRGGQQGEGE